MADRNNGIKTGNAKIGNNPAALFDCAAIAEIKVKILLNPHILNREVMVNSPKFSTLLPKNRAKARHTEFL